MEGFIENVRNWIIQNISNVMTNLVVPTGAIILIAVAVFSVVTGILKMKSKQDDFKTYLIASIICVGGAVVLGSIWVWGRSAAGV